MLFEQSEEENEELYPWATQFIKAMHNGFWTDGEFNFQSDIQDFKVNLTEEERGVIVRNLSAISQVESVVKQFWNRLGDHFPHKNLINLGIVVAGTEVVHNEAYERLLKVLDLKQAIRDNGKEPALANRVKYLGKRNHRYYKDARKHYIHSMILFTLLVENVSLFSQFYTVLWFGRYKNVLKDTNQQVLYTKNEELVHGQIGTKIVNVLREEYSEMFDDELEQLVMEEVVRAYEGECELIDWILGDYRGERISPAILKEFVKSRFNESLVAIGYKAPFILDPSIERDYEWVMEEVLGNNVTDFFYKRPVDYAKKGKSFSPDDLF